MIIKYHVGWYVRECAPYDLAAHPFHELPNVTLRVLSDEEHEEMIERR